jgi:hypothetical protein
VTLSKCGSCLNWGKTFLNYNTDLKKKKKLLEKTKGADKDFFKRQRNVFLKTLSFYKREPLGLIKLQQGKTVRLRNPSHSEKRLVII